MSSDLYVDLPDTEPSTGGSDKIPAGEYKMRVTKIEHYTSAEKETPALRVSFEVIGGEYDGSEIQNPYWLTPAAMGILQGFLKSCGVHYKGKGVNAKSAIGKTVIGKVKVEKGTQGGEFSTIHYVKPVPGSSSATPPPSDDDVPPEKTEGGNW